MPTSEPTAYEDVRTTRTATAYRDELVYMRPAGTLYDVLDLILDRGMVIDVFIRVSLVGIEILKIDARIVVASVDTYLRFAEVCNRLDLEETSRSKTVPDLLRGGAKTVGKKKAKSAISGAAETVTDKVRQAVGGRRSAKDENDYDDEAEAAEAAEETEEQVTGAGRTRRREQERHRKRDEDDQHTTARRTRERSPERGSRTRPAEED